MRYVCWKPVSLRGSGWGSTTLCDRSDGRGDPSVSDSTSAMGVVPRLSNRSIPHECRKCPLSFFHEYLMGGRTPTLTASNGVAQNAMNPTPR